MRAQAYVSELAVVHTLILKLLNTMSSRSRHITALGYDGYITKTVLIVISEQMEDVITNLLKIKTIHQYTRFISLLPLSHFPILEPLP